MHSRTHGADSTTTTRLPLWLSRSLVLESLGCHSRREDKDDCGDTGTQEQQEQEGELAPLAACPFVLLMRVCVSVSW